jgi:hypothetical protein
LARLLQGAGRNRTGRADLNTAAEADAACDYAICVFPDGDGRQHWMLLDDEGEAVLSGEAADQAAALAMARSALEGVQLKG